LELSLNLQSVGEVSVVDPRIRGRLRAIFRVEVEDLVKLGSVSVLEGSVEGIAEQLIKRRERLGISYLTLADDMLDSFAPVVARLVGK
jgi:hypothetical protein